MTERLTDEDITYLVEAMKEHGGAREHVGAVAIRQLQADITALAASLQGEAQYAEELREALAVWPVRAGIEGLGGDDGFWRSCSGCHELNEGQPTGPYNPVLSCCVGIGCGECGGIGAVWDTTDYAAIEPKP